MITMETIANKLTTLNGIKSDIKQALTDKGASPTNNFTTYAGLITNSPYFGKYKPLDRVKDDSNNEIGTVSGFFTDSNNVEYAVVCLDAQYRGTDLQVSDDELTTSITNLPIVNAQMGTNCWYLAPYTAKENCDIILDFCTANNATSSAINHCRNLSFIIEGVTYYGQLPNIREVFDIFTQFSVLNSLDITASSYPSLNFSSERNYNCSTGRNGRGWWLLANNSNIRNDDNRSVARSVIPVLEIPNS